jgi:L-ascorbate metabolism protein UlaG (beta-lactamase superfamily)
MSVQLEFIGHACFRVWQDGVPRIVTDPYDHNECKLPNDGARLEAETVIVSSLTDRAHANVEMVVHGAEVINALDVALGKSAAAINGTSVAVIPAAEDPNHPRGPQDNALYAFMAGGLWFCHMGDLGYPLSNEDLSPWEGKCDVLIALTGQKLTPKFHELDPMIEFLSPKWLVPMHFGLPPLGGADGGGMTTVDRFLNHRGDPALIVRGPIVEFPAPRLSESRPTIVVLEPSGYKPTGGLLEFICS